MDQARIIDHLGTTLRGDQDLRALFLAGSLGRGEGDRFSDVDFLGVAEPAAHEGLLARWRALLEDLDPLVFWSARRGKVSLANAIAEDWTRCDLLLVGPDNLGGRVQAGLKPLIDPEGLFATLPERAEPRRPSPERLQGLVGEALRIHGLLPVVLGRGELLTAVQGYGMIRDLLIDLMKEEAPVPDAGGMLHLSRTLPPEDMATLIALPSPRPEREEVIAAHAAVVAAFLARARPMLAAAGAEWPEAFEAATRRHLGRELGLYAEPAP